MSTQYSANRDIAASEVRPVFVPLSEIKHQLFNYAFNEQYVSGVQTASGAGGSKTMSRYIIPYLFYTSVTRLKAIYYY